MDDNAHPTSRVLSTRRRALVALGAVAVGGVAGCLSDDGTTQTPRTQTRVITTTNGSGKGANEQGGWRTVVSPTGGVLYDVAVTQHGPVAVGEGGAVLLRRTKVWTPVLGDEAETTLASDAFHGADATANGRRLWFAGGSGTLGVLDVDDGTVADFSAPLEKTSSWTDVAVAGLAESEWIYLVNGSGELLRGERDRQKIQWHGVQKPGSGTTLTAISFAKRGQGVVVDTGGHVYRTVDGGRNWHRIGIETDRELRDVVAVDADTVVVAATDGTIFQYDGVSWTTRSAGSDDLLAVTRDERTGLVSTANGSVYALRNGEWNRIREADGSALYGVAPGTASAPAVVVGDRGRILELID